MSMSGMWLFAASFGVFASLCLSIANLYWRMAAVEKSTERLEHKRESMRIGYADLNFRLNMLEMSVAALDAARQEEASLRPVRAISLTAVPK